MYVFTYTAAVLAVLCICIAAIIMRERKDDLAQYLAIYICCVGIWIGSNAIADVSYTDTALRVSTGMALIGGVFFISFYLIFTERFVRNHPLNTKTIAIFLTPSIILSLFAFSKHYVIETYFPINTPAQILPGWINYPVLVFVFGGMIYGVIRMLTGLPGATNKRKKQIFYITIGFVINLVAAALFTIILPILGELRFFTVGPQFAVFMIFFVLYAIFRHQLLDARIIIQRGLVYSLLFGLIALFYAIILSLTQLLIHVHSHAIHAVAALATTTLGIFTVPHVEYYFKVATDKIFFRGAYSYPQALHALSQISNTNIERAHIISKTTDLLKEIFRIDDLFIFLSAQQEIIDSHGSQHSVSSFPSASALNSFLSQYDLVRCAEVPSLLGRNGTLSSEEQQTIRDFHAFCIANTIDVAVTLRTDDSIIGAVLLGRKKSDEEYTKEDIRLLQTFAHQFTVALEKARLYEQVREYSVSLEEKVAKRTSQIKILQEQQSQMILNISHSLQTPLTVLKGEIGAATDKNDATRKRFVTSIDYLSQYITDILRLAKMENPLNERMAVVPLSHITDEIVEYFTVIAAQQKITVDASIEPNIQLFGIQRQLEELIKNLLSNSIKYIANKRNIGIVLRQENGAVVLTVSDTGIGIPERDLPHLFERFYRVQDERTNAIGTGLGLAICARVVENHKGHIDVNSTVDIGTTITVTLPIVARQE